MAELSGSGICNPAVQGLCPPLATCWICFGLSQVQIPGFAHTLKVLENLKYKIKNSRTLKVRVGAVGANFIQPRFSSA